MTISANFTINGAANPAAHQVTYGSTVNLELLSYVGASSIEWTIESCSDPDEPIPTMTVAGSPNGRTASFVMPADSTDGYGRTFLIKCKVSSSIIGSGGASISSVSYGVVGAPNDNTIPTLPVAPGEENYRHATHGWGPEINRALVGGSGGTGPQGPQGPPGTGIDPTEGEPGFTAGSTGVLLETLTLETGKHYQIVYRGINYNGGLASGVRTRPFDITVCVSTLTGSAVQQSLPVGQPQPLTGSGQIEFAFSGLDAHVYLYGGDADTEWFGDFTIVTEYDPAVQIPDNWTPVSEASCKFAFDPSVSLVHTGGLVDSWGGQIGSVSAAGTSTTRPTRVASHAALNNQPTVRFDNAHGLLITGLSSSASNYMFFAVLDVLGLDTDSYLLDCQTGRLILSVDRSGGNYAWLDTTASFRTATGAATGPQKVGYIMQSSESGRVRKNGSNVNTGMLYTQTAIGGTVRMGRHYSSDTTHLNAHVGYFCCFSGVSEQIRFRTETYLQTRFGI